MPFKPFSSVTGRNSYSLFDIRLDQDFLVFRGNAYESSGQLLKGVIVLCLSTPIRVEEVRLRLTGTMRITWTDPGSVISQVSGQKTDQRQTILDHRWPPFVGAHGRGATLPAGNYEYPFELSLPGTTAESVEGIPEASITYRLKATVVRGKLAYDLHAYKHLRIIRTIAPAALDFSHAMSVENIWPNKVDYSIILPSKAVPLGGVINMKMRFTPLLKGLDIGEITAKMMELRTCWVPQGLAHRSHHSEREVASWHFEVNREEHWHDMIEDSGQEGWAFVKQLNVPKRLRQCIQDLSFKSIKVRHKIKLTVALSNPDGHTSELRATLPVSIFISPHVPMDEQGNLVNQTPDGATSDQDAGPVAPPGYGQHVLDQLFEDMDIAGVGGVQTPTCQSGVSSPFYTHSRAGSADNLAAMSHAAAMSPAALSSRLANVSLDPSQRNHSYASMHSLSGRVSPTQGGHQASDSRSEPHSAALTRSNSEEDHSEAHSVEHVDQTLAELAELNRVPSYATAVRTPARSRTQTRSGPVPDYQTALNAPRTPPTTEVNTEHLSPILEYGMTHPVDGHTHVRVRSADLRMTRVRSDEAFLEAAGAGTDSSNE